MTSYIQFSGELSLQTVSMFQVKRVSLSGVARITESEQFLLEEYKIGKIIRLWNPESRAWHPEAAQGIRSPTSDWNPESKFHLKGRSPVPGMWNPLRGIQSPRLSWIPKGALTWDEWWISSYLQINLSCKKTCVVLLRILLGFAPRLSKSWPYYK